VESATHTRSGSTLSPEACFRAAVDLARKQGAKSFELRSTVALAREQHDRGLTAEAKELVRRIRVQFTEGLDTQDIRDADEFLMSLEK
jgi:adenylate cyclase